MIEIKLHISQSPIRWCVYSNPNILTHTIRLSSSSNGVALQNAYTKHFELILNKWSHNGKVAPKKTKVEKRAKKKRKYVIGIVKLLFPLSHSDIANTTISLCIYWNKFEMKKKMRGSESWMLNPNALKYSEQKNGCKIIYFQISDLPKPSNWERWKNPLLPTHTITDPLKSEWKIETATWKSSNH